MLGPLLALGGPLGAFVLLGLVPPLRRSGRPAAWVSILGMSVGLFGSIVGATRFATQSEAESWDVLWLPLSRAPEVRFGLLLDGLSAQMALVVALVALLVQIYSLAYMASERPAALGRYYAYHSLFAFSMLGLVLSHNTLQTYAFWELVGLGSYLLIGFWFERAKATRAALKAFWVTRLGDAGFAVGLVLLWAGSGSFVFVELFAAAESGALGGALLTLGVAGLFLGAMGKSAQFPLHVWLPDAMEGPTPVSALIHAATMVAAGVFLMVRISPLLAHAPRVAGWVLAIGALTALLAATLALVERDLKRILAHSTVSQLGYMMAAVGAAAPSAAFFHLCTHAVFKALLFLSAGSLIQAAQTSDIFGMGRLWRRMPVTGSCFLLGGLALCGLWPTAGFFSKDEILAALLAGGHPLAFVVLLLTAVLTAFYLFRAFFTVFFGPRGPSVGVQEPSRLMIVPMAVLAMLVVPLGFLRELLASWFWPSISVAGSHASAASAGLLVPIAGSLAAASGLIFAWLGYQACRFDPGRLRRALSPLARLLERRYFIDDAFEAGYRTLHLKLSALVGWIDRYWVDGAVNAVSWAGFAGARRARSLHNGKVQDALYAVALGMLLLVWLAWRG